MIGPGTDEPVLWTISPPALHIYLGANHILKSLQKQWGYLVPWLKEVLHIVFAPYHGETLEGNDLAKVLANLEKLSEVVPEEFAEYLHCLACFKEVTNACLTSKQLSNNYQEKITEFSESVYALKRDFKMTISNKMHILISDVPRFIEKVKGTIYKQKDIFITKIVNMHITKEMNRGDKLSILLNTSIYNYLLKQTFLTFYVPLNPINLF